ncbi:hypothetical protein FDF02_13120, partial [Clostridium botulinum]|nr:hypothetical protein [Clostridium botulinum]
PGELAIVIVATYVIGVFLKNIESVKDKYITVALMIFAIVFSMILSRPSATAFLQGVLCWGVAVGLNQTGKQLNKQE